MVVEILFFFMEKVCVIFRTSESFCASWQHGCLSAPRKFIWPWLQHFLYVLETYPALLTERNCSWSKIWDLKTEYDYKCLLTHTIYRLSQNTLFRECRFFFFWDWRKRYLSYCLQFQLIYTLIFFKNFKLWKCDIPDWILFLAPV